MPVQHGNDLHEERGHGNNEQNHRKQRVPGPGYKVPIDATRQSHNHNRIWDNEIVTVTVDHKDIKDEPDDKFGAQYAQTDCGGFMLRYT